MKKFITMVALVASLAGAVVISAASPAAATGKAIVPGAGSGLTVITVDWITVARSNTTETLWIQLAAVTAGKVNTCGTGLSVWYNDANGVRRNLYQADDRCIWGPAWSRWTPNFTAKRGTCVEVTYRMDGNWRTAKTFCII